MKLGFDVGVVAGAFDIIHPGYIRLFEDAKLVCRYLIVALHVDPQLENPQKMKPVFSVYERAEVLEAIRFVDEVVFYRTEADLDELIMSRAQVRISGSDHEGEAERCPGIPVYYHSRQHDFSTTLVKKMIRDSFA